LNRKHLLVDFLYCGKCGQKMICQKRKRSDGTVYKKYICKTYHQHGRKSCDQPNIDSDWIEEKIVTNLKSEINKRLQDIECCSQYDEIINDELNDKLDEIKEKIEKVKIDTVNLVKSKELLSDELFNITAQTLDNEYKMLIQDQELIIFQLKEVDNISFRAKNEMESWLNKEDPKPEVLREFVATFIKKISVLEGRVSVDYHFK
jgi:site-specific DNA recombinase